MEVSTVTFLILAILVLASILTAIYLIKRPAPPVMPLLEQEKTIPEPIPCSKENVPSQEIKNEERELEQLGYFDLRDTKKVCDLLEKHNIEFEVEMDDSAIRNMNPLQARHGGAYGDGISAYVYVPAELLEKCKSMIGWEN